MHSRDFYADQDAAAAAGVYRSTPHSDTDARLAWQARTLHELRTARRRPARVAAAVVAGQMVSVFLANEAPGAMAYSLTGRVNIGLTLALAQVVITGCALAWYSRYAKHTLEPLIQRHAHESPRTENAR